jgi:hypothetical protein
MLATKRGVILLTVENNVYLLMVIDDEGYETLEFSTLAEALLAKRSWDNFLNGDENE